MPPNDFDSLDLLGLVARFFEKHGITYRVVGSMASMTYGEPRLTLDVDIVADLKSVHVSLLLSEFAAPEFYLSERAMRDAILRRHQFNVIHPASGLKVDVILPPDTEYARMELTRGRRLDAGRQISAWFASAEDVILNKLCYFRLGGSEKHLRDINAILKFQGETIDRAYIEEWAAKLNVAEEWRLVRQRGQEGSG